MKLPDGYEYGESATFVFDRAEEEARGFWHNYVGTEHMLLAMCQLDAQEEVVLLLGRNGINREKVRSAVEFIIGRGGKKIPVTQEIGFSPLAEKSIMLAAQEQARLGESGPLQAKHLLLGILQEAEGIAAGMLYSWGLDLENLHAYIAEGIPSTRVEASYREVHYIHVWSADGQQQHISLDDKTLQDALRQVPFDLQGYNEYYQLETKVKHNGMQVVLRSGPLGLR